MIKVYYLEDKGVIATSDDVVADPKAVQHGTLSWYIEEDKLVPVPPDSYYWVVLQVELSPEDCKPVYSEPIRTRAALPPDPPVIGLVVEGVDARQRLEERICELSIRRDRLGYATFPDKIDNDLKRNDLHIRMFLSSSAQVATFR